MSSVDQANEHSDSFRGRGRGRGRGSSSGRGRGGKPQRNNQKRGGNGSTNSGRGQQGGNYYSRPTAGTVNLDAFIDPKKRSEIAKQASAMPKTDESGKHQPQKETVKTVKAFRALPPHPQSFPPIQASVQPSVVSVSGPPKPLNPSAIPTFIPSYVPPPHPKYHQHYQQPQQQYYMYPQGSAPAFIPQSYSYQSPPAYSSVPERKTEKPKASSALEIIDPKTGKAIDFVAKMKEQMRLKEEAKKAEAEKAAKASQEEKEVVTDISPKPKEEAKPEESDKAKENVGKESVTAVEEPDVSKPKVFRPSFMSKVVNQETTSDVVTAVEDKEKPAEAVKVEKVDKIITESEQVKETDSLDDEFSVDENPFDETEDEEEDEEEFNGVYTIQWMMEFKNEFTEKPSGLDDDCLCLKGSDSLAATDARSRFSTRSYGRGSSRVKGPRGFEKRSKTGRAKRKLGKKKKQSAYIPQSDLHQSENRWTRSMPQSQVEEITRQIKSILNKLTFDKFKTLSDKLLAFVEEHVSDSVTLRIVVDLIFDKALSEPTFASMYANLCSELDERFPEIEECFVDENGEEVKVKRTFSRILLNQCQKEFESGLQEIPEDTGLDAAALEELRLRQKLRWMGYIVFIGEMYKSSLISGKIMKHCLMHLIGNYEKQLEDLEALCKLFTTIGPKVDKELKEFVDRCFIRLDKIVKEGKLPSRYRFAVMDVIELRSFNWVPRRHQETAKTLDQIHKDSKKKQPVGGPRETREPKKGSSGSGRFGLFGTKKKPSSSKREERPKKVLSKKSDKFDRAFEKAEKSSRFAVLEDSSTPSKENVVKDSEFTDVTKQIDSLILEYYNCCDLNEAEICIEELTSKHGGDPEIIYGQLAERAVSLSFEKKDAQRTSTEKFLLHLMTKQIISVDQFQQGMSRVFGELYDLSMDAPNAPVWLGRYFSVLVHGQAIQPRFLEALWDRDLVRFRTFEKLVQAFIRQLAELSSQEQARSTLEADNFDVAMFLKDPFRSGVEEFVSFGDLSWLVDPSVDTQHVSAALNRPVEQLVGGINEILGEDCSLSVYGKSLLVRWSLEMCYGRGSENVSSESRTNLLKSLKATGLSEEIILHEAQKLTVKSGFSLGDSLFADIMSVSLASAKSLGNWANSSYQPLHEKCVEQLSNLLKKYDVHLKQ